ncbi:MAG: TatD family hydrolase [Mycoplasmatales bacterium]|nr:TatD family hydrolase [Mycoplasmatales bacterium]
MKYIDTHCHLNSKEYKNDYSLYVKEANNHGVEKLIIPGTSKEDSLLAIELSKEFSNVFAMVALHPSYSWKLEDIDWLKTIDGNLLKGVGETGIDLYWESNPPLDVQTEIFKEHLRFALKYDLPVAIHTRSAEQETFDVLTDEEFKGIKFLIHCSTMSKEWVMRFVEIGGYISFSGIVTFKNANFIKEAALAVPIDRILSETDAPYLTPVPFRGKMNKPEYVRFTADYIAKIRKEKDEDVLKALYNNANRIFNI